MPVTNVQAPLPRDAKITFPQFASYGIAMEHLIQKGLGMTFVTPMYPRSLCRNSEEYDGTSKSSLPAYSSMAL